MSVIKHKFNQENPNQGKQVHAGTIENWSLAKSFGYTLVYGTIVNDKLGRFADGEPIHTSYLCSLTYDPEFKTGEVTTRNSIYSLGALKEGFKLESFLKAK
jgi:hypothetical protein